MLVYKVLVIASASMAKQNTSWMALISWGRNMQSTLAYAAIISDCILHVEVPAHVSLVSSSGVRQMVLD